MFKIFGEKLWNFFGGLVFIRGGALLPSYELGEIRKWALKKEMITESELQFLGKERIEGLFGKFLPGELLIGIDIFPDPNRFGKLLYFEFPYISIKSLIKRGEKVEIAYWHLRESLPYNEVRFGFWGLGTTEEFCSISNAKLIVKNFEDFFNNLQNRYPINEIIDWTHDVKTGKIIEKKYNEIEVNGDIIARFYKSNKLFDVELTLVN
ncbi:MAG: hypothetical protein H5T85_08535 [Actinobacteria bacterium]|nr:hypothetical protein [Actinomycetota bacterium]